MPEPKQRIIVDGVEFHRVVDFPRIVSAATAAMQPARLMIALMMVIVLITIGRVWDRVAPPAVSPGGLMDGPWSERLHGSAHQNALRDAMSALASSQLPQETPDGPAPLETATVKRAIASGYRDLRSSADDEQAKLRADSTYEVAMRVINATRSRGVFEAMVEHVSHSLGDVMRGAVSLSLFQTINGVDDLLIGTTRMLWRHHRWFAMLFGLMVMVVFSIGGGAIARMSACQVAGEQRISLRDAVDFATGNAARLFWALALPLLIMVLATLPLILMGVLMWVPVLDVIGGLLYGLALVIGFAVAFLLVGYAVGFPLLVSAVAVENCDGADAMQRTYAYVVTRPLHLAGYYAVALAGLALGFAVIGVLALLTLEITAKGAGTLTANPAMDAAGGYELFALSQRPMEDIAGGWTSRWAGAAIMFWQSIIVCLAGAYVFSYFFSAATVVYLLMRKACDGQDTTEIWRPGLVPGTQVPVADVVAGAESMSAELKE